MEVTVPITPRRTRALRPLLPPGPGGVDNVSSRGDRYGRHRLVTTRILIALRSDCHQGKRQLAGNFHAGGRAVAWLVIGSCGGAIARGAQHARRFGGDRYGPPQGRPLTAASCDDIGHAPAFDGEHDARLRAPKARWLAWERGMGARATRPHPGEPRLGARMRASGPRSRATTNSRALFSHVRAGDGRVAALPWVVRSKRRA